MLCFTAFKQQRRNKMYEVIKLQNGWYNFEKIDQSKLYMKVCNLNCQSDIKAINTAKKIIGDKKASVIIKQQEVA